MTEKQRLEMTRRRNVWVLLRRYFNDLKGLLSETRSGELIDKADRGNVSQGTPQPAAPLDAHEPPKA